MGVTLRAWVVYYPAAYVPLEAFEAASSDGNATAAALLSVYGISWYTRFAQSFDMYFDHVRQRDTYCVEELTIDLYLQYTLSSEWALQPLSIAYIINNRPSGGLGWAEWPALLVRSVYEIYEHTGDLSLLAANYDELLTYTLAPLVDAATGLWTCPDGSTVLNCNQAEVKIAAHLASYYVYSSLIAVQVDWPPTARDGFVFTPTNTVVNAIVSAALSQFSEMAAALGGHDADAALLAAQATAMRAAVNSVMWSNASGAYRDGATTDHEAWHSTVFALGMGVPTPDMAPAVATALLRRLPAGNSSVGACFPSSVWPTQWALEGLYAGSADDHGRAALNVLTCAGANGWIGMLEQGATQAPEAWSPAVKANLEWGMTWGAGGWEEAGALRKMARVATCDLFRVAPGDIIPRYVLGVRPLLPGYAAVLVRPQPGALSHVAGVVPTIRGPVGVRYGQNVSVSSGLPLSAALDVALPGNLPATLCLPLPACPGAVITVDGSPVVASVQGDYACLNTTAAPNGPRELRCPAGSI